MEIFDYMKDEQQSEVKKQRMIDDYKGAMLLFYGFGVFCFVCGVFAMWVYFIIKQ